jgi:hypothetical protein
MQGANIQQDAAGQAATMQAQQQLAAQQQMAQIAQNQVGNQIQSTGGLNQYSQGAHQNIMQALGAQNNAHVTETKNFNDANAERAKQQGGALAGLGGALEAALPLAAGIFTGGAATPLVSAAMASVDGAMRNAAHGGEILPNGPRSKTAAHCMKAGGTVPGKAKVAGDSLKNDVVSAKLSPGEVVIPRSVMNSADPAAAAAKFVAAIMARKGHK